MKIIFSPSKTMKYKDIDLKNSKDVEFTNHTKALIEKLKSFSIEEIGNLFKLKGKLLEETYNNIQNFATLSSYRALSLYDGVTFRQLEIEKFSDKEIEYLNKNLFILSALYGAISPNTEIKPYRLDMTINILDESMYKFWSRDINNYLDKYSTEIFINLASKEFSKILDYKKFKVIDIEFRQNIDGKLKNISTEGKKARGMMLNYITLNQIEDLEKIKEYLYNVTQKIPTMHMHFCENQAADGVLGYYSALAKLESIPFHAKTDLPSHIAVDEIDMCLVLSNLLENAIQASQKTEVSRRKINVEIYLHYNHLLLIQVENTFDGEIRKKNDIFQSSKRTGNGIGIQSVRHIAEKTGGASSFTCDNGVFTAKIMLRPSKNNANT